MTGHVGAGRDWWWWRSKPLELLDPHRIVLAATPVKPDIVAAYRADPDRPSSDSNDPCVTRARDGTLEMSDGKHRTLAARAEHRLLWCRVADE